MHEVGRVADGTSFAGHPASAGVGSSGLSAVAGFERSGSTSYPVRPLPQTAVAFRRCEKSHQSNLPNSRTRRRLGLGRCSSTAEADPVLMSYGNRMKASETIRQKDDRARLKTGYAGVNEIAKS